MRRFIESDSDPSDEQQYTDESTDPSAGGDTDSGAGT